MNSGKHRWRHTVPAALSVCFLALLLLLYPEQGLRAALRGIAIWWDVLFPALFPFFVASELMIGFGIVHFAGTLLDPMMRPLFRVPGCGGFVMAMGFASGYPVGARLTGQLWDARLIDRQESEKLIAFTTTADPIFLIGAVSVGFFQDPSLALVLTISHYGGAVALGLLMRGRRGKAEGGHAEDNRRAAKDPRADEQGGKDAARPSAGKLTASAFRAMHQARLADGRPVGQMLLDGIRSGIKLILVVGGLVVFFSVAIEVLTLARVLGIVQTAAGVVLGVLAVPAPLSAAVVNGLFEVTLGVQSAAMPHADIPLQAQVAVASFGLSWAGLSVHAQVMSLVSHMPVRYGPFAAARLIHGVLSACLAYLVSLWLTPVRQETAAWAADALPSNWDAARAYFLPVSALTFLLALAFIPAAYAVYRLAKRLLAMR